MNDMNMNMMNSNIKKSNGNSNSNNNDNKVANPFCRVVDDSTQDELCRRPNETKLYYSVMCYNIIRHAVI